MSTEWKSKHLQAAKASIRAEDKHFIRLLFTCEEATHAWTNVHVEPLRKMGLTKKVGDKDLAYWVGHITQFWPFVVGAVIYFI